MLKKAKTLLYRTIFHFESQSARKEWNTTQLLTNAQVGKFAAEAIECRIPFLLGKLGANELNLLLWRNKIYLRSIFSVRRLRFKNLRYCKTNAGLKPYTRASYIRFADLLHDSLSNADILGIWKYPGEMDIYKKIRPSCMFAGFFDFDPWFMPDPWSSRMANKRIFCISPFLELFQRQMNIRERIWSNPEILPNFVLGGYKFPFLVSEDNNLDWRDVYAEAIEQMRKFEPDVVLTGCGALGLPLALEAKKIGAVGLHLGGMLQLLFGVRGKRYDADEKYARLVNRFWIRPPDELRPPGYEKIENGCYW